jgi:hypothetical protein
MTHATSLNTLETLGLETRSVLKELEEIFPVVTPSPDDSIEQIMYRSGQRSVVDWLQQRIEK